jgi:hypothetical protein
VLSSLLCFLHCGRQNIREAGMTLHDHVRYASSRAMTP